MKTESIKIKLLLLVFISTLVSFVILGFNNTNNNYNSQDKFVTQSNLNIAKDSAKFINSYLQSKIDIVDAVRDNILNDSLTIENKDIVKKMDLAAKSGNFALLYVGFEKNGNFLASDGTSRTPQSTDYDSRKRDWYKDAVASNKSGITAPYVDYTTKKLVVSIYSPLKKDGQIIGVVASDIFIDTIVNTILNIKFDIGEGLAYLIDSQNKILIHKDKKLINKKDNLFEQVKTKEENSIGEATLNGTDKLVAYGSIDTAKWKVIIELDKDSIYKNINNTVIKEIFLYVILLVIILGIIFYSLLKILAPIKTLEDGLSFFFRYLKGEEQNIKEIDIKTNDEFGKMAKLINSEMIAVADSINQDRELINDVKSVVNNVKNGKLDIKVQKESVTKSLNELKDILNEMIQNINDNVNSDINIILNHLEEYSKLDFRHTIPNPDGNISKGLNNLCEIINQMLQENKHNGETLTKNSDILLTNVDILNKSSNETAVSLEETAAALEEITSTVINNTSKIADMDNNSKELISAINQGRKLANSTVVSMDEINEQTQSIADAITVIDQIAFQTNILSLNAAVEAATAGEAGKGFAVVAQEVRNLAARSAEAAKEIKELVENATLKTDNGKNIADEMIKGYENLNQNISKTTSIITDISEASVEQRQSIEQINDVVNRLDQQTQNNASVATQTHSIAMETSTIADKILNAVHQKKFRD